MAPNIPAATTKVDVRVSPAYTSIRNDSVTPVSAE